MIRCCACRGRIRPPPRAWTTDERGRVSFYAVGTLPRVYEAELARIAKRVPFVHERCEDAEGVPESVLVARDLGAALKST